MNKRVSFFIGLYPINDVNIALGKPAEQSHRFQVASPASNAVDGVDNPYYGAWSCSHTKTNHESGAYWWQVDLLGVYNIGMVQITNRADANMCKPYFHSSTAHWAPRGQVKYGFFRQQMKVSG